MIDIYIFYIQFINYKINITAITHETLIQSIRIFIQNAKFCDILQYEKISDNYIYIYKFKSYVYDKCSNKYNNILYVRSLSLLKYIFNRVF